MVNRDQHPPFNFGGGGYPALYVFNRGDIMLCTLHYIGDLLTNGFNDIAHGLKR